MKRVLFICGANRRRSPTAEQVFAGRPDLEVASAGLRADADTPVSPDLLQWADLIFVMEPTHRTRLSRHFKRYLRRARVICLDIPDTYAFMDPALVATLRRRVERHL